MNPVPTRLVPLALAVVAVLAPPVRAQEPTYTVTPSVGVFLPATDLVGEETLFDPGSGGTETVTLRHQVGPTLGVRAARRLFGDLALEIEALLALSEIELTFASDRPPVTQDARVFNLGVDVRYEVFRAPFSPFSAHVMGGAGLVVRAGEFFSEGGGTLGELEGGSDFGFIVGSGFRYGLDPKVTLRVDVRDYISSYALSAPDIELDSKLQHDIWVSLGLEFAL